MPGRLILNFVCLPIQVRANSRPVGRGEGFSHIVAHRQRMMGEKNLVIYVEKRSSLAVTRGQELPGSGHKVRMKALLL